MGGNSSEIAKWAMGVSAGTSAVTAAWALGKANQAKNNANTLKLSLEDMEKNRQSVINPYANISNAYENIGVATKAAEIQAEQADISLANTLDAVKQTGAGGATALAQAALKSKQGISADIQKQEQNNQELRAKGAMDVQKLKAAGEEWKWTQQEDREMQQLDRMQNEIDQERTNQMQYRTAGFGALTDMASNLASFAGMGDENNNESPGTDEDEVG
jgi:hypothetical protein